MLGEKKPVATVAVRKLATAKEFYEGKLGLTPMDGNEKGVVSYRCGGSTLLVYESQYAGTNEATAVTWSIGSNLEDEVSALKAKGVTFEHYDMPGTTLVGDIHVFGKMKNAWFKDPDGNIHSLINQ